MRDRLQNTILYILKRASDKGVKDLSRFQIVKLLYLIQVESQRYSGEPFIENLRFFREKNGPLSQQIYNAVEELRGEYLDIVKIENKDYGHPRFAHRLKRKELNIELGTDETMFLNSVLDDYLTLSQKTLRSMVYETEPMKEITDQEKKISSTLIGAPINTNSVPLSPQVVQALAQNEF